MTRGDAGAAVFAEHRDHLVRVANRMLGAAASGEGEDVVQEAWLRWDRADRGEVADARAYLVRITTRLALDRIRRAKARREVSAGGASSEPTRTNPDLAADAERTDAVSLALLVVLRTLSPPERAVFVLREAFALPHAEIARIVGRSEPAVRQLARRAREHVDERRPRFETDPIERRRVTERFLEACESGDLGALMGVLAPGVPPVGIGRRATPPSGRRPSPGS